MEKLRDELTGCIGCGCLSLRTCRLINRDDVAAVDGAGSYLLADRSGA
jgi:MerR family redox-sensitive transcriptional activator SoxR